MGRKGERWTTLAEKAGTASVVWTTVFRSHAPGGGNREPGPGSRGERARGKKSPRSTTGQTRAVRAIGKPNSLVSVGLAEGEQQEGVSDDQTI